MDKYELLMQSKKIRDFVNRYYNVSSCIMLLSEDEDILPYVATLFAMRHVCDGPCLKCEKCKKILGGTSIDFYQYPKYKNNICTDDINEFVDSISKKPLENDKKIYIFNKIENATEESENKLLKSMEEFPTYVKLIFTSSNTHGVLRTILSRVEVVRIPRFTFEEFKDILSGEENASGLSIDSIYSISSGNLFYGLKLLQDSTVREVYENCLEILLKIDKKNIAGYSIQINKNNLEEYIRMFTIILSKMITSKTLNSGEYDLINSHYTIKALADISNELEYSNKKIIANVNEQGIIDNLLIKIMEAKI